jgi:hypothetical protein
MIKYIFLIIIIIVIYILLEYIKVVDNNENSSLYGLNMDDNIYELVSNNIINPNDLVEKKEEIIFGTDLAGDNMKLVKDKCYYIAGNILMEIPKEICKKNIKIINENNKVFAIRDFNIDYVINNNIIPNRNRHRILPNE